MLENTTEIAFLRTENERLHAENIAYKQDILLTVENISKLLTDIGILTPQKTFEFSMSKLTRNITAILVRPASAETKFGYLGSLGEVITKYAPLINESTPQ